MPIVYQVGETKRKGVVMGEWLECRIAPGQFSGEYAVQGEMFDDTSFSLFAPEKDLKFSGKPTLDLPVNGLIRIVPGEQKDNLLLVSLPRPTFENGRTITVKREQLKKID